MNLETYLIRNAALVESALRRFMPRDNSLLSRAMRYSVLAGGKRLRPVLVLEGARICGGKPNDVLPAACAVEFIHTYSLIHDDLPAMDDDDLRRGRPTSHKKFGEATAILAGDALLTDAFGLLVRCAENRRIPPAAAARAVAVLSEAAGSPGMVAGQMKDTVESDAWRKKSKKVSADNLGFIHRHKTAALIRGSLLVGATLASAPRRECAALADYGEKIGLMFQIVDDILDITGDKKLLGKKGSDRDNNKLTYPALFGLERSQEAVRKLCDGAKRSLSVFGAQGELLSALADHTARRRY